MTPPDQSRTPIFGARRDPEEIRQEFWSDFDSGWIMTVELVTATVVWGGIGWLLDLWLGTDPVLVAVGLVIGFCTGFWILWARSTGRLQRPAPPEPPQRPTRAAR